MKKFLLLLGGLGLTLASLQAAPPQTNWVGGNNTVAGQATTLTGSASDPDGDLSFVKFYVTGPGMPGWNEVGTVWIGGGDATPSMDWTPSQAGGYAVHMRAWDSESSVDWNGNVMGGFDVASPNSSPQTNWASADNTVAGQATTLSGNASDPDGNLSFMKFYVTGPGMPGWNEVGTVGIGGGNATGSMSWTPSQAGSYAVHVRAWDSWGWVDWNGNVAAGFEVNEANHSPHTESAGASGATAGQPMTLTGRATDPDGNLSWINFYVTGPGLPGWNYVGGTGLSGGDASGSINWTPSAKGDYAVHVRAWDTWDWVDWNASVATNFTVAGRAPTGTIRTNAAAISVGQSVVISVDGADQDGDLHYINIDQVTPTLGTYGPGDTGTQTPPYNGAYDLGGYYGTRTRDLTLTLGAAGTYVFRGAMNDDSAWYYTPNTVTVTVSVPPDTTPPSTPAGLHAGNITNSGFTLSWNPSTDNVGVTGYRVYISGNYAGTTTQTSFQFGQLLPNHNYSGAVQAIDAAGNLSPYAVANVTTLSGPAVPYAEESAWLDVNGDGIRDEIIKGGTSRFDYSITDWWTDVETYWVYNVNNYWIGPGAIWNGAQGYNRDGSSTDGYKVWSPTWYQVTAPGASYGTVGFTLNLEAGYDYWLLKNTGTGWTHLTGSVLSAVTGGLHSYSFSNWNLDDLFNTSFALIRIGKPLGSVNVKNAAGALLGTITNGGSISVTISPTSATILRAADLLGKTLQSDPQVVWNILNTVTGEIFSTQVSDTFDIDLFGPGIFQVSTGLDNMGQSTPFVFTFVANPPPPPQNPRVVLLLHGMNSNYQTWDSFVTTQFGGSSGKILDGRFIDGVAPTPNANGIYCYRMQFGALDPTSTRTGVEAVSAQGTVGYLEDFTNRCGDFETFSQLADEVDNAIDPQLSD